MPKFDNKDGKYSIYEKEVMNKAMDKDQIIRLGVEKLELENAVSELYKKVNYLRRVCVINNTQLDNDDVIALDNIQKFCVHVLQYEKR